jgi:hypothetical protein
MLVLVAIVEALKFAPMEGLPPYSLSQTVSSCWFR